MRHDNDEAATRMQRPAGGSEGGIQRIDILKAQEKGSGIELLPSEGRGSGELRRLSDEETNLAAVVSSSMSNEPGALVQAAVTRARRHDGGSERAGAAPNVEKMLSRLQRK